MGWQNIAFHYCTFQGLALGSGFAVSDLREGGKKGYDGMCPHRVVMIVSSRMIRVKKLFVFFLIIEHGFAVFW